MEQRIPDTDETVPTPITAEAVERVRPEDLERYSRVQTALARAAEEARAAADAYTRLSGVSDFVASEMVQKYQIGPHGRILNDGTIVRE